MQIADAQPQTKYNDQFTGSQAFSANPELTLSNSRADLAYRKRNASQPIQNLPELCWTVTKGGEAGGGAPAETKKENWAFLE